MPTESNQAVTARENLMEQSNSAVRVKFMGDLPALIGRRTLALPLPKGSTVGELLARLSSAYGDAFTHRVFSGPGTLHHYIVIFVGGRNIKELGGLSAPLGDGEVEVVMLPMFEGG